MCGIVGVAGNTNLKITKAFRDLLIFDQVRGLDSTGVVSVAPNFEVKHEKRLGSPLNLWSKEAKSEIFDEKGIVKGFPVALIGHNRAATFGEINEENAHPFVFGNTYGVHNGTLRSYDDLAGHKQHKVDSQCLINHIDEHGIEDAWKNFHGAAAVVWWDDEEKTINLIRNEERPLWVVGTKNMSAFLWASEPWMLRVACQRNGVELNDKEAKLQEILPNHHYKFKPTNITCKLVGDRELEKKKYVSTTQTSGYGGLVGFKSRSPFKGTGVYGSSSRKSTRQINTSWTTGTEKLGKETRGILFNIVGENNNKEIICETVDKKHKILVIPNDLKDYYMLSEAVGTDKIFRTNGRVRVRKNTTDPIYRISSLNIGLVMGTVTGKKEEKDEEIGRDSLKALFSRDRKKDYDLPKDEAEEDIFLKLYPGPDNINYSRSGYQQMLEQKGIDRGGCCYCGNPIEPDFARLYEWITKDDCLCEDCANNKQVKMELMGYFPSLNFQE